MKCETMKGKVENMPTLASAGGVTFEGVKGN